MDEKLSKALEFGNYSTTLNNQRRMLKEKFTTESMYFVKGGQFTITKELINYVYTLNSTEQDSFVLIDDTDTPILIEDISDFYNNITDKYYVALNNYHKDYSKLEKSRSVDGLVEWAVEYYYLHLITSKWIM